MVDQGAPGGRGLRSDAHRNRERVVRAAVTALHRDGLAVPMASIAADAGVGIGTVYRHFPTREDLLEELTCRSFRRMLDHVEDADRDAGTAREALRLFLGAVVADRDDLVLPSTGGPAVRGEGSRALQHRLHQAIRRLIARGAEDGSVLRPVDVPDVAWLGAALAPPGRPGAAWDAIALRLLDTYLAGLGTA